jgi:hypothetical protein
VQSHFVVFTSHDNAAHFTLVKISHYEFGNTPCIPYLISINWVFVIGYMHAVIFSFSYLIVHELLLCEDQQSPDISLLCPAVVIALITVAYTTVLCAHTMELCEKCVAGGMKIVKIIQNGKNKNKCKTY